VDEKFEEMLLDMNLTDEAKRAPLRAKPMDEKRNMLVMQFRGNLLQVQSLAAPPHPTITSVSVSMLHLIVRLVSTTGLSR